MSRIRKALAAFLVPFLALNIGGYVGGDEAFTWSVLAGAFATGLAAAFAVYFTPNAPPVE